MPVQESLISREHRKFLEERRSDWVESRKKLIEQFPFLIVTSTMPYPSVMNVWKDEAHLDGFIYLFKDGVGDYVRSINTVSDAIGPYVGAVEDGYFSNNLDECPYFSSFETFEDFLNYTFQRNRNLERELEECKISLENANGLLLVWEKRLVAAGIPLDVSAAEAAVAKVEAEAENDSETENDN